MPRCLNCKEKFVKKYPNQQGKFRFCLLKDECIASFNKARQDEQLRQWNKEKQVLKKELKTVQSLMKDAQVVFNKYIRQRDKGELCISCQKPPKKENAGHYFSSGGHKNITFNEDNVHLQCEYCNTFLHGNLLNYQIEIQKKIGADRLLTLHEEAHKTKKFTREELKEIIAKYKKKLK